MFRLPPLISVLCIHQLWWHIIYATPHCSTNQRSNVWGWFATQITQLLPMEVGMSWYFELYDPNTHHSQIFLLRPQSGKGYCQLSWRTSFPHENGQKRTWRRKQIPLNVLCWMVDSLHWKYVWLLVVRAVNWMRLPDQCQFCVRFYWSNYWETSLSSNLVKCHRLWPTNDWKNKGGSNHAFSCFHVDLTVN